MAENLAIEGRMSVRSPMQWSNEANAGFSAASEEKLRRPVVSGDEYGPSAVNVADQRRDKNSMLNWMERLIRTRKECPEIGWGTSQLLDAGAPSLFAQRFDWGDRITIVLHNLAGKRQKARLHFDNCEDWEHLHDLLGDGDPELLSDNRLRARGQPVWLSLASRPPQRPAVPAVVAHDFLAQGNPSGTVTPLGRHQPPIAGDDHAEAALVADGHHLPDLPPLISGQRWRWRRRSERHPAAARLPEPG